MSGTIWSSESSRAMHERRQNSIDFICRNHPQHRNPVPNQRRPRNRRDRQSTGADQQTRRKREPYQVSLSDPTSFDLEKIADHENLAVIWRELQAKGGHAPGVDGMTPDVSPSERFYLSRNLSRAVLDRRYVPEATLLKQIMKPTGGFRTLGIPTFIDRVIGAALSKALRPALTDHLPRHYGAGANCHSILGRMTVQAEDHGWYWIAIDDIRDCFPSIPCELAMDCFMRQAALWNVPELTLVQQGIPWLARQLIYGHEGETRTVGLSQGSTFSPVVASIVFKEVLDIPTDRSIENRMIRHHRYADNLHVQGPDRSGVRSVMDDIQSILNQNGMQLKGTGTQPIDVRRPTDQTILGITPRWTKGKLSFDIPGEAWERLRDKLCEATDGSGPGKAQSILKGFIAAYRPTIRENDGTVNRIHRMLREEGNVSISEKEIIKWNRTARMKWQAELNNIRNPRQSTPPEQIDLPELDTGPWDGTSPPFRI
jgi:RNA-directed DNA polymerase